MRGLGWFALLAAISVKGAVAGDAQIRAKAGPSEIIITTTSRLAGAIHSLTWNGREFIDSADHGRQLQSAANFDAGSRITGETYNPTEAGSRFNGAGPKSTSVLRALHAKGNMLSTVSQMAFWLRPGEKSGGQLAKNKTALSSYRAYSTHPHESHHCYGRSGDTQVLALFRQHRPDCRDSAAVVPVPCSDPGYLHLSAENHNPSQTLPRANRYRYCCIPLSISFVNQKGAL